MTNDLDEQIRRRAHEIWESEGRPEGRHEEHWLRAREQIEVLAGMSGTEAAQKTSLPGSSTGPVEPSARTRLKRGVGAADATTAAPPRGRSSGGTAASLGTMPGGLDGARGKEARSAASAKYRHPENPDLTWSGRGRRPDWIREAVEAGRSLSDFEIRA